MVKYFLLILLLSVCVSAIAPTQFYGRVMYDDGMGVAGIEVNAQFIDETNKQKTVSTTTISFNSDMPDNLIGYYFFNRAEIQAKSSSDIIITVSDEKTSISANPNSKLLQAPTIVISRSPIDIDVSDDGIYRGYIINKQVPLLPTSKQVTRIYGTLIDDKGVPLSGVQVSASYINFNDSAQTVSTTTGQGVSSGRFTLDTAARKNSTIVLEVQDEKLTIKSNPGNTVEAVQIKNSSQVTTQPPKQDGTTYEQEKKKIDLSYLILGVMGIGGLGVLYALIFFGKKILVRWRVQRAQGLHARIRKLHGKSITEIMQPICVIGPDATILAVMNQMILENNSYILVMKANKAIGIITVADILAKIGNLSKLLAKDVMHTPVSYATHNMNLQEAAALSLSSRIRIIPILRGDKVVGVVTRKELLEEYDRFFSTNEVNTTPTVNLTMSATSSVQVNDKINKVIEVMKLQGIESVFVTRQRETLNGVLTEVMGIVKEMDLLEEICNYNSLLDKMDVGRLMKIRFHPIMPSTTLHEANRLMLDQHSRVLAVTKGQELLGVVNEVALLQSLYSFTQTLLQTHIQA